METIEDVFRTLSPERKWRELTRWPPDVFAITATLLAESGAYRFVVSPPPGASWPDPVGLGPPATWEETVTALGVEWATAASMSDRPPLPVRRLAGRLWSERETRLRELGANAWDLVALILNLNALADEACAGLEIRSDIEAGYPHRATTRLVDRGTLSRLPRERVRVLPKLRVPESGITIRSLSRHVAVERSEVDVGWTGALDERKSGPSSGLPFSMLLVPWPETIRPGDFREARGPILNLDVERYGFFEFVPDQAFDVQLVKGLVAEAHDLVGPVDAVILPESVLEPHEATSLQQALLELNVPFLIAGVRQRALRTPSPGLELGANYVYVGTKRPTGDPSHVRQDKHHRWWLDDRQLHQYHLASALDPTRRWWEATEIPPRCLSFVTVREGLTICPLVCEDLARPDPVSDVIRCVGPTLVVAILLDGPQLISRWPARYATVLADDPGCSVLTLTSLGMAERCQPTGSERSRVVALWRDRKRGSIEIELERGASGILLSAYGRRRTSVTADGRTDNRGTIDLILGGIEQISPKKTP
jgi:hypothetical protein